MEHQNLGPKYLTEKKEKVKRLKQKHLGTMKTNKLSSTRQAVLKVCFTLLKMIDRSYCGIKDNFIAQLVI